VSNVGGVDSLMVAVSVALAPFVLATASWLVVAHLERRRNRRRLLAGMRAVVHRRSVFPVWVAVTGIPIGLLFGLVSLPTALWTGALALVAAAGSAVLGHGRLAIDPDELDLELRTLLDEAA
jgi:hypothetical protein